MFEGVKFIPRDQIDNEKKRKRKKNKKKKSSKYSSSDEELERVKRGSSKKKWYSSEESESDSGVSSSEAEERRGGGGGSSRRKGKRGKTKKRGRGRDDESDGGSEEEPAAEENEIVRKEMGLEWMLKRGESSDRRPAEIATEESKTVEPKANPRELNPYLKDDGSGYPEEKDEAGGSKLLPSSLVGDGGASWRLKALKRAKEQAARDGVKLEEVVEERWGSLGQLAVSVSSHRAAPARAHLQAINSRKRGSPEESRTGSGSQHRKDTREDHRRDYLKDVSVKVPKMREPKVQESLSWGRRKSQQTSSQDGGLISETLSSLNKFAGDGSFMREVLRKQSESSRSPVKDYTEPEKTEPSFVVDPSMSANQLAAKALQLRLKGKLEEAEQLMQQVENIRAKERSGGDKSRSQKEEGSSRFVRQVVPHRRKKNEDDGDINLARKIMQNKKFSVSGQADDEYDYDDDGTPSKKSRKKRGGNDQATQTNTVGNRFSIKQEDCILCYENPKRPSHLVVSVGNFTYLMLPQWEAVVPGHCCILPMQHVPSSRCVDDYVWGEIRNFKKRLIMMFAKQEKAVVFIETVIGLAKQRRHCMIECVPLPHEIADEAPHYFKNELLEAESEWSQHHAKSLIETTSAKGLMKSIPENVPYFHVEFGLDKGFLHPIDDESLFAGNFGLNVIRGMMELPEEDMYRRRRRRHESVDEMKDAVRSFARDWAPFDWTEELRN